MEIKALKTLTGTIKHFPELYLHILLTEEEGVIVARCLDFSVSSHGENEADALASLSESITDYIDYAVGRGAFDEIIDPDDESLWNVFWKQKSHGSKTMLLPYALKGLIKKFGLPDDIFDR
ncbi:MAG: hypothetical protein BWK80_06890 [Desulfobacteraceae bacterium IS3]|nr:MAG: hypothetical protein BWK80_06890 [Desulfobacteraceae bacterium IS3]